MIEQKVNSDQERRENCDNEDSNFQSSFLNLEWIFGFNPSVAVINLTTDPSSKSFAAASGHIFQIFRCDDDTMQSFIGHESEIFTLETDATGRFVVSADKSGMINIWDTFVAREFPHPIRTIYEPYSHQQQKKLSKLSLSHDARIIITANDGRRSSIKLWQWSETSPNGDKATEAFELPEKYNKVESLKFSQNEADFHMFVVTTTNGVAFGLWDKPNLHRHFPARAISITFQFVDSIFVEKSHKVMSITSCGSVVIWSDVLTQPDEDSTCNITKSTSFKKEFIKSLKLGDTALKVIKSVDGYIMISDELGHIKFYDSELKILFWCPSNDSIDSIMTVSFDLKRESTEILADSGEKTFSIRDFFVQTKSDIFSVEVAQMKFNRVFYKSDDFLTAIDISPLNRNLICCANYSGRIFIYDYRRKTQIVENQIKLQKRKSSTSDVDVIETPHVTCLAFSPDGHHLLCGLENGNLLTLDPNVLHELKSLSVSRHRIEAIKFSPDSSFVVLYDKISTVILLHHDRSDLLKDGWTLLGRACFHSKPICDVLYISPAAPRVPQQTKNTPRLISLGQDRRIVEYDLVESLKDSTGVIITFHKRIFQSAIPVSMTLVQHNNEQQLLVADNTMKFKIFDKNTFEILATFLGPIYDSHVKQFHADSIHSKFFIFATEKNICGYALPVDGNPFKSLGFVGHSDGVKCLKVDSTRKFLFSIGNTSQSVFMWQINPRPIFEHLNEGGVGLKPYCDLLPGGKFGAFFQQMQDLFFYMLLLSNNNSLDAKMVKYGLDVSEVPDYMRSLGFYPSDYEIECLQHELQICGKRKIPFEDLVKLFINYSHQSAVETQEPSLLSSFMNLLDMPADAIVTKEQLIAILTESAEKVSVKDAESYLKEIFRSGSGKLPEEISLADFALKLTANDGSRRLSLT